MRRTIEALWAVFHDNEKEGTSTRSGSKFLKKERHLAREYSLFSGSSCHMHPAPFVIRFRKTAISVYATCTDFYYVATICYLRNQG